MVSWRTSTPPRGPPGNTLRLVLGELVGSEGYPVENSVRNFGITISREFVLLIRARFFPAERRELVEAHAHREHVADVDGYNIARVMREATRRMQGYSVELVDIGLTAEDILEASYGGFGTALDRVLDMSEQERYSLVDAFRKTFLW